MGKLEALGLRRCFEIQDVRKQIDDSGIWRAEEMILKLTGKEMKFTEKEHHLARVTVQAIVEFILKFPEVEDGEPILAYATRRAAAYVGDPANAWAFATSLREQAEGEVDKAKPHHNKRQAIFDLYKEKVLNAETPLSRAQLVEAIAIAVRITKAAAQRWTGICEDELGSPAGGLQRSKFGRKKKVDEVV